MLVYGASAKKHTKQTAQPRNPVVPHSRGDPPCPAPPRTTPRRRPSVLRFCSSARATWCPCLPVVQKRPKNCAWCRPRPCRKCRKRAFSACRSEEHTSELQSLMRSSYAVFCLKKNTNPVL